MSNFKALEEKSCVIFDLDDTLIDTEEAVIVEFNSVLQEMKGESISLKKYREIQREYDSFESMLREKFGVDPSEFFEKLNKGIEDNLKEHLEKERIKLYSHTETLVRSAKNEFDKVAALTDSSREYTDQVLTRLETRNFFDTVVTSNEVARKPSKEGIEKICEELNIDINQAILVGNSINDKKAAEKSDIPMVQVKRPFENTYSDFTVENLKELSQRL